MLRQRVLVAVIALPVGLAAIILGGYYLLALAVVITVMGLHEYYSLLRAYRPNLLVGYLCGVCVVLCAFFLGTQGILLGLAALMAMTFLWALFGKLGAHLVARMALTAFGVVWVAIGFAFIVLLRELRHGMALAILMVACTVMNDTFAFFVGKTIGHYRLAPGISPNKSVEGAIGGLVGAVVAALIVRIYSDWMPTRDAVVIGLLIGIIGQWGDLFESAVKRDFKVKDSGRILPGHGGILDRFDSMLFAGVATYWLSVALLGDLVA
jgi:phosphatidate cytidylyltransferase